MSTLAAIHANMRSLQPARYGTHTCAIGICQFFHPTLTQQVIYLLLSSLCELPADTLAIAYLPFWVRTAQFAHTHTYAHMYMLRRSSNFCTSSTPTFPYWRRAQFRYAHEGKLVFPFGNGIPKYDNVVCSRTHTTYMQCRYTHIHN